MAKTKVTARKSMQPICPQCKKSVPPDEKFEQHLIKCTEEKEKLMLAQQASCDECGKIFKRFSFMMKHKQMVHATEKGDTVKDKVEPGCSEIDIEKSEAVDEGWDRDPDIELDYSDEEEKCVEKMDVENDDDFVEDTISKKKDLAEESIAEKCTENDGMKEVNVDMAIGRVTRKPTKPLLPGVRKRCVSEVNATKNVESNVKRRITVTEDTSRIEQSDSKVKGHCPVSTPLPRKIGFSFLRCVQDGKQRQEMTIRENEDVSLEAKIVCPEKKTISKQTYCLGDYVADGLIKPDNIIIEVSEDGMLQVSFETEK
ncbi:uncharacterized protein LOC128244161 [Mya arenaria]|uniref:uncharacterized protein LOC128244161 n=1 Tax=Mya arenaria TaxID=6604 RepID=UPI0022E92773|nr:uncharacterized protein LOC128244161 [Mya arenaria]